SSPTRRRSATCSCFRRCAPSTATIRTTRMPIGRRRGAPRRNDAVIPLQRLRDDADAIREGARRKGEDAPIDEILELDIAARRLRTDVETLRAEQKRASSAMRGAPSETDRAALTELKQRIQAIEAELAALETRR